jgi:acetyltransferase-like isoleucine patch superfamily enzyme
MFSNKLISQVLSKCISLLPTSRLRVFSYNLIFNYKITNSQIGFGSVINVAECRIDGASIGRFNQFTGPMKIEFFHGVTISDNNQFRCGYWLSIEEKKNANLYLQANVNITSEHYFDVSGGISINNNSWVAGRACQFWTHGAGLRPKGINIGSDCYIGSAVLFSPGSELNNRVTVAIGTVLSKPINESEVLLAGCPAIVKKRDFYWKNNG